MMFNKNKSLLMRSKDEVEIESILVDIVQSEKIEGYGFRMAQS
jgi:hypothetical protein